MDGAQLGRRAHVGLTLVTDDLVGDAKLLEQPQQALRTGIVEVMDDEHGLVSRRGGGFGAETGRASRTVESRDAENRHIIPGCYWLLKFTRVLSCLNQGCQ